MATRRQRWIGAIKRFLEIEAASGVVLAAATLIALVWANSPWAATYFALDEVRFGRVLGHGLTPHWFIDDVLMTVFFFVVGLEIRRELSIGELSDRKRAALPAIAALGGMIAPALLYLTMAGQSSTRSGWGIPTATDIAFALGVLSLLGNRVPPALRILLLALAVIDDLGAIIVIAVFYTHGVHLEGLLVAAIAIAVVLGMQRARVRAPLAYALPAIALWTGLFYAGIHPTIAGVALGLLTPVTSPDDAPSPSERFVTMLHPYVAFGVMPLFALANAGVAIGTVDVEGDALHVMLGIALGLIVGKPLGIVLASVLAIRTKVAEAPAGLGARHLLVLGVTGGVGFTMALFVSGLAFRHAALRQAASVSILGASALVAALAWILGRILLPPLAATTDGEADRA